MASKPISSDRIRYFRLPLIMASLHVSHPLLKRVAPTLRTLSLPSTPPNISVRAEYLGFRPAPLVETAGVKCGYDESVIGYLFRVSASPPAESVIDRL